MPTPPALPARRLPLRGRRLAPRAAAIALALPLVLVAPGCSLFAGLLGDKPRPTAAPTSSVGKLKRFRTLCVVSGRTPKTQLRPAAYRLKTLLIQALSLRDAFTHVIPARKDPEELELPDGFDADETPYVILSCRLTDGRPVAEGGRSRLEAFVGPRAWFDIDVTVKSSDDEILDRFHLHTEADASSYGTTTDALEPALDAILAWVEQNR